MAVRWYALIFGIIYVLIGLLGLIPGALTHPIDTHHVTVQTLHGNLLGLFPVNILHTLVHLGVGIWGIAAYKSFPAARVYARSVAIIFAILTIFGLVPGLNTFFGLIPLHSHDVWLHALTAAVAAYFGWAVPATDRLREPYTRRM